jgi:NAD(P)-dependent dehydrogenase (short-subunit alcohol dehydrogenase family)
MPNLTQILASNSSFFSKFTSSSSSALPTAVFIGGTAGIGQGTAHAFARATNGNANIIIVGRNQSAASEIIASFPKPTSPDAKHVFVPCDVTLMKNVGTASSEILKLVQKVNYVVISTGFFSAASLDLSAEGIDRRFAVYYYGRWKFIHDLMPALERAKEDGEEAKVISVLAAGRGDKIDLNDLGLKKDFGILRLVQQGCKYNDLMCAVRLLAISRPTRPLTLPQL